MLINDLLKKQNNGTYPWPYNLLDIYLNNKKYQARPVEFDHQQTYATKWHTTCTECGQLIEFSDSDIGLDEDERIHVYCRSCKVGMNVVMKLVDEMIVTKAASDFTLLDDFDSLLVKSFYSSTSNIFRNPIAEGLLKV